MTRDEVNQYAEGWVKEMRKRDKDFEWREPLPQIMAQFGWDLQKRVMEEISEIVLGVNSEAVPTGREDEL